VVNSGAWGWNDTTACGSCRAAHAGLCSATYPSSLDPFARATQRKLDAGKLDPKYRTFEPISYIWTCPSSEVIRCEVRIPHGVWTFSVFPSATSSTRSGSPLAASPFACLYNRGPLTRGCSTRPEWTGGRSVGIEAKSGKPNGLKPAPGWMSRPPVRRSPKMLGRVASSPNDGSHVLEAISSPESSSVPHRCRNPGERRSQILQLPQLATPNPYPPTPPMSSELWVQEGVL